MGDLSVLPSLTAPWVMTNADTSVRHEEQLLGRTRHETYLQEVGKPAQRPVVWPRCEEHTVLWIRIVHVHALIVDDLATFSTKPASAQQQP